MIEPLESDLALKLLTLSAGTAILWSSLLGLFMMIPHMKLSAPALKKINFRHLLSAHLDWFMLAFMQSVAALLIFAFALQPPKWIVIALIFGGWMNAVPYFLRAFGINAFVFGEGRGQRAFYLLGGISVIAIISAWTALLLMGWSAMLQ